MNILHPIRVVFLVLVLVSASVAWACFWDSDTLRTEANGMPGVVEAATGFYPVYPDEYYERRIEIARERIDSGTHLLDSYDNLAVALDKLGDSSAAIEAIAPKLELIEQADDPGDHLYRYHANLGTFYAHRWIRNGTSGGDLKDLELAQESIARAIEINPDAHFGREFVQLGAIEWLLNQEAGSPENMWIGKYPTMLVTVLEPESIGKWRLEVPEKVVEGLIGLVMLGAAQESVDVYAALAIAMSLQEDTSLGLIAALRVDELVEIGRHSIHPTAYQSSDAQLINAEFFSLSLVDQDFNEVSAYYDVAREAADEYRAEYTAFVQSKLDQGLHPDTHEAFFEGEPKAVLPEMPNGLFGRAGHSRSFFVVELILMGAGATVIALFVGSFWFFRKRIWISTPPGAS
ncbi:MAG: hypothetical protein ED559_11925 [Phycisphaera sp.]|nr:MAG: hypothetical protein ED559_11925 [Phycisphaera sp.]